IERCGLLAIDLDICAAAGCDVWNAVLCNGYIDVGGPNTALCIAKLIHDNGTVLHHDAIGARRNLSLIDPLDEVIEAHRHHGADRKSRNRLVAGIWRISWIFT